MSQKYTYCWFVLKEKLVDEVERIQNLLQLAPEEAEAHVLLMCCQPKRDYPKYVQVTLQEFAQRFNLRQLQDILDHCPDATKNAVRLRLRTLWMGWNAAAQGTREALNEETVVK